MNEIIDESLLDTMYKDAEEVDCCHCRAKYVGKDCIVKICDLSLQSNSPKQFENEVQVARLAAFHLIGPRIHEYGQRGKYGYLLMDRMQYSLKRVLDTDTLNLRHLESLVSALYTMWKYCGFVHLDLHAENIWFDSEDRAKLIDYGFVVWRWELQRATPESPFVFRENDDPAIVDVSSALTNSMFDVRDIVLNRLQTMKDSSPATEMMKTGKRRNEFEYFNYFNYFKNFKNLKNSNTSKIFDFSNPRLLLSILVYITLGSFLHF